ncbi:MAG: hypothetical protein PHG95_00450 [Patescibacteria group bacterium]|nr:hypothetical protein [Patescibacteria group bacterium]
MKKVILLFLLTISVGFLSAQEFYLNPLVSIGRIDTAGARLVRQLAFQIAASSNQNKFLISGEVATGSHELKQRYAVFTHHGKRYSVYYQWDVSDVISLANYEFLRISVRPEGTDDPEHLTSFKDYHLNGSWDEYFNNQYIYPAEYEDEFSDSNYQKKFIESVKDALTFFK